MKKTIAMTLILSLFLMYGCIKVPMPEEEEVGVVLTSNEGTINQPIINGQPFGYEAYQPGDNLLVSFIPSVDQYGNKAGLSNSKYTVKEVEIMMPSKNGELDTVFWVANLPRNQFRWVPGWTGAINPYNDFPWAPFIGFAPYMFDCQMDYGSQLPYGMPSQTAEMLVEAEASWMEVEFVAEDLTLKYPGGYYKLDVKYSEQFDVPRIKVKLEAPGSYSVSFYDKDGRLINSWDYTVPASWFWIDNVFYINVGGNGQCG